MPYKDPEQSKKYHNEYNKAWYKRKRLENPGYNKEYYKRYKEANVPKRLILSTKASAKLKGLDHTIVESDLVCPILCPYLGIPIDYTAGNGKTLLKPSVDRINPDLGYIPGNVEVISSLANTMKNRATKEQLLAFATVILSRYG